MKLYFSSGSSGLASQIALREAAQLFELVVVVVVDLKSKKTVEGDYYAVNPKGGIPALKLDSGNIITEDVVILEWIANNNPDSKLLPPFGTRERYSALEWLNFIATDVHRSMAVLFSPLVDDASKTKYAAGNLTRKFQYIEKHLASNEYLLGGVFSVADAYLYNVLRWPERVGVDTSGYTAIRKFMSRMEQRPTVLASLNAEKLQVIKFWDKL